MAASAASSATKSLIQSLKRFFKKPWEITGPCADPEYKNAVPGALEYRVFCPATVKAKACIPNSDPETVYDIKYYSRDQRRNRPPIRRTILKKADVEKIMKEKSFDVSDFPKVYLTAKVEEDYNARGGGRTAMQGAEGAIWDLGSVFGFHPRLMLDFFKDNHWLQSDRAIRSEAVKNVVSKRPMRILDEEELI
ncbi:hypothetical protein HHK36_024450 [Tetracentron sinense]|uniref:Uncharacterized protein n=1 Tax=Tetracentron sinense TaxID=13715 RepID=A0A834Y7G1_TETSI|nr:hypothetical protein HHK36_032822 [Tetracentron sinense]KAF8389931.1 hypothetical protein HHK36_024450 [Tetracentron sinense]